MASQNENDDEFVQSLLSSTQVKFKSLKCYLNNKDVHFLVEPKILPCSNTACLDCIRFSLANGTNLNCRLCNQVHANLNPSELKSNDSVQEQIDANAAEITNEIIERLNNYISSSTDKMVGKNELVESLCVKAKKDVAARVDVIKAHIETLYKELLDMLGQIKQNVSVEVDAMSKRAAEKCVEYEKFAASMEKMLDDFEVNRVRLETEIYTCQSHLDDLDLLEQSFHRILRKVAFDESDWKPDQDFVCEYIGKFTLLDENKSNDSDDDDE